MVVVVVVCVCECCLQGRFSFFVCFVLFLVWSTNRKMSFLPEGKAPCPHLPAEWPPGGRPLGVLKRMALAEVVTGKGAFCVAVLFLSDGYGDNGCRGETREA